MAQDPPLTRVQRAYLEAFDEMLQDGVARGRARTDALLMLMLVEARFFEDKPDDAC